MYIVITSLKSYSILLCLLFALELIGNEEFVLDWSDEE